MGKPKTPLAPLRKIVERQFVDVPMPSGRKLTRIYELLECGHRQPEKSDIYGPTNADRRRCRKCLKEQQPSVR